MLDRQIARCGVAPRQIAADGGYASLDNLNAAKARGVSDVAFHKKRGLGGRRHGQEPLGLSQTAQLSRRDRGRDLLPQASLWFGTLHLARARSLQLIHLVLGCRPQPGSLCTTSRGHDLTAARIGRAEPRCPHAPCGTRKGCNCNYSLTEAGNCCPRDRSGRHSGRSEGSSSRKKPRLWMGTS